MVARILARPVTWLIIAGVIFLLVGATLHSCSKSRSSGAEASLSNETGKAGAASASDAIGTLQGVSDRQADADKLTRENEYAIRNAEGASAPVNPGVDAAGRDSLCKRAAYRCTEQCLQRAAAKGVANPGAGCPAAPK